MRKSISFFCVIFIALLGTPAVACRSYDDNYWVSVVRAQLPAKLPEDAFVARIEVERPNDEWSELAKGVRVRVTRVLQGTYIGEDVIVRDQPRLDQIVMTSCGIYRFGGAAGYVIGTPVGYENGVLVIQPAFLQTIPRRRFYDLPDLNAKKIRLVLPKLRLPPAPQRSTAASPRSRRAR